MRSRLCAQPPIRFPPPITRLISRPLILPLGISTGAAAGAVPPEGRPPSISAPRAFSSKLCIAARVAPPASREFFKNPRRSIFSDTRASFQPCLLYGPLRTAASKRERPALRRGYFGHKEGGVSRRVDLLTGSRAGDSVFRRGDPSAYYSRIVRLLTTDSNISIFFSLDMTPGTAKTSATFSWTMAPDRAWIEALVKTSVLSPGSRK